MQEEVVQVQLIVHGDVQGVFFRSNTRKFAQELKLVGTVKNIPDGTVEIITQATLRDVNALIESLRGYYEPGQIKSIEKTVSKPTLSFSDFRIIR